ncbi:MAG: polyprenyl synthetase family protein [Cyclobacteriaceae bacterium]
MNNLAELAQKLNGQIERMRFGDSPNNLYEPIRYLMSLGGKRLRPLLTLLSYQLKKSNPEDVVDAAIGVEVFHNFTLMHDDIMDNAPLRRGQTTVHEKWDDNTAILSGDTMLVKAYDQFLSADSSYTHLIFSRFNKTAVEVCEGQQLDMNFEQREEVQEEEYLEMIRLKTAVLLGFSLELGGILSNHPQTDKLYEIGESMGLGFQLMDDLLDVYADKAVFGKQVGGDIIANKKTFLLINALQRAKGNVHSKLHNWLLAEQFDPTEKVEAITGIYNELGIHELTTAKMNDYFDKAITAIDELEGDEAAVNLLKEFARRLMQRNR